MDIKLSLNLPRDRATVPLVRHLAKHALWEINVTRRCVADVELAVTEASANVIEHTAAGDEYVVNIDINDVACEIRVVDTGHGFDHRALGTAAAQETAEGGRGIQLMRALVDNVSFESRPETGTVVHLVKRLEFDGAGAPPFIRRTMGKTLQDSAAHE